MKPQLVIQDFQGAANAQLDATRARLLRGGSWKKQRVVVIIPSADLIPAKVALSLWNLAFPPNQPVVRTLALGMEVGDAYSTAIEGILSHPELKDWEYLLTLEHDNMPPYNGVVKLIERLDAHPELSCVGGLYFTKGEGGVAQIWGDPADPVLNFRPQVPKDTGLVECCGTGMGFNLWRLAMFKDDRLRKPWFKTLNGSEGGGVGTQDLYAWSDFRKYGYRCAVDCDVRVGHYSVSDDMVW
jgi:hypothetical protein